jgi:hypothetical protein
MAAVDQYYLIMNGVIMREGRAGTWEECFEQMKRLNTCKLCNNRMQIITVTDLLCRDHKVS